MKTLHCTLLSEPCMWYPKGKTRSMKIGKPATTRWISGNVNRRNIEWRMGTLRWKVHRQMVWGVPTPFLAVNKPHWFHFSRKVMCIYILVFSLVFHYCLLSEFWLRKKLQLVPIIAITFTLIGATSLKVCDKGPCITWKVLPALLFLCNELYASIYGSYFVIKVCLLFFSVFLFPFVLLPLSHTFPWERRECVVHEKAKLHSLESSIYIYTPYFNIFFVKLFFW